MIEVFFTHRLFELARDYFRNAVPGSKVGIWKHHVKILFRLKVVGGVLSPTHDAYEKSSLIPATHRLEMARFSSLRSFLCVEGKYY